MSNKEKVMWLLAQQSPTFRSELREKLGLSQRKCDALLGQLKKEGRIVHCGPHWVAASLYEVMFGPSFEKGFRYRQVQLGGTHDPSH